MADEHTDNHIKRNSPISRSLSLDNIHSKTRHKSSPAFLDDTATGKQQNAQTLRVDTQFSDNPLLRDLDNILRNKLKVSPKSPVISRHNSLKNLRSVSDPKKHAFMKELGLEGDVVTINQNSYGQAENVDEDCLDNSSEDELPLGEDEDDDDFVNVDEIDGPIGAPIPDKPQSTEEDTEDGVDYNLPANQDFQKSIDQRVAELETGISAESKPQLCIDWIFHDYDGITKEITDWFSISDYNYLPQTVTAFNNNISDVSQFIIDDAFCKSLLGELTDGLSSSNASKLMTLTQVALGNFPHATSKQEHIQLLKRNNKLLALYLRPINECFKDIAGKCREDNKKLKSQTVLLFYSSTILFLIINTCIEERNNTPEIVKQAISTFEETDMLQFLTEYIEFWRWNSRLAMRIRNIITLLYNLILLQFGDSSLMKQSKVELYNYHNMRIPEKSEKRLTISPLHFQAFQEDLKSRFPTYDLIIPELPQSVDNSNSLSQFLEIPRPKARSTLNSTLPIPDMHIATPAPSPPSSPVLLPYNDGLKARKSFQANMAYPYLYPSDDEKEDSLTDRVFKERAGKESNKDDVFIPKSVQEAASILKENIDIKLSVKQLWDERELFMATERGWKRDQVSNVYDYNNCNESEHINAIDIMKRVDNYYSKCLPSFNSLIFVLTQIIESNLNNTEYKEDELPEGLNATALAPQLEIVKAKELSLRSSAGILYLLLKWFKLSHALKFEQFSALLYDSGYITASSSILGKYALNYLDKAFNRTISSPHTFWKMCSNFNPSYESSVLKDAATKETVNNSFMVTIVYLLKVLRKVTGSKTHRLKTLPMAIGPLFNQYYTVLNLDVYHPILKIVRELTPFKNKRWKSEHMELISGVFMYERLDLVDNWVTGKDIYGELMDAYGQEVALRALVQFYNFEHYETSLEDLGYKKRSPSSLDLLYKDSEYASI